MTPTAKLKARFQEVADDPTIRFEVRRRKTDFYVTIFSDSYHRDRYVHAVFPGAYMTSSAPWDCTFRIDPAPAIERILAEMEVDPAWLEWHDGTVVKVAEGIRKSRTFERLPVLADALEEAGCANLVLLKHCRANGPHFHSCWVADLLVGEAKK
jgi:hypothetical protein